MLVRGAIEFVVIVVGVLVALAVDQWAQEREERQLLDDYLAALVVDLEADRANVARGLSRAETNEQSLRTILGIVDGDVSGLPLEELVPAVERLGFLYVPEVNDFAYRDLQASGRLRLLPAELRRVIQDYFHRRAVEGGWMDDYSDDLQEIQDVRPELIHDVELRVRYHREFRVGDTEAEPAVIEARIRARADRLRPRLSEGIVIQQRMVRDLTEIDEDAAELIEALRAYRAD